MRYFLLLILLVFSLPLTSCKAEEQAVEPSQTPLKSLPFLVVDLDGDGFEFIPLEESNVYFDVDGDGLAERTAWIKNSDGFLWIVPHMLDRQNLSERERFLSMLTHGASAMEKFDTSEDGILNDDDQPAFKYWYWKDENFDLWPQGKKEVSAFSQGKFSLISKVMIPNEVKKESIKNVGTVTAESYFTTRDGQRMPYKEIHFYYEDTNTKIERKK